MASKVPPMSLPARSRAGTVQGSPEAIRLQDAQQDSSSSLINATVDQDAEVSEHTLGVDNMIYLVPLTSDTLLENIRVRYCGNVIYTFTGSILVAVNPYQVLPIYTAAIVHSYFRQAPQDRPPHVFSLAETAIMQLMEEKTNQSIIISGESGSGKTENTKLILQYLAIRTTSLSSGGGVSSVEQKILQASPVLEAWGNARTVRNNNSSRFGKFIEILFNGHMQINGAIIHEYLLEKSRIVHQNAGERNYHIFYGLCAQTDEELTKRLHLSHAKNFNYTNQSGVYGMGEFDPPDSKVFERLIDSMNFLGITPQEQDAMFQTTAAVLHFGNVEFDEIDKCDGSKVRNMDRLKIVSDLLGVSEEALAEALTCRYNTVRGETFKVPLRVNLAYTARDSMAKALYERMFSWLVTLINSCIMGEKRIRKHRQFIGVLDIFGFENFETNSFEQICINYANERLQLLFNTFIFKQEQLEYRLEGIANWEKISFSDNQGCVDLLEKKSGILGLLDEDSRFPGATDASFVTKLHKTAERDTELFGDYYLLPKNKSETGESFGVKHYAGIVEYKAAGMLDKNRDMIPELFVTAMLNSSNSVIASFYNELTEKDEYGAISFRRGGTDDPLSPATQGSGGAKVLSARDSFSDPKSSAASQKRSLSGQFKDSLIALCEVLGATQPHYIRCIKPNSVFAKERFDTDMVEDQLRYSGTLETIRIRKEGYPNRRTLKQFCDLFMMLNLSLRVPFNLRLSAEQLLAHLGGEISPYQFMIGETKIFIKDEAFHALLQMRKVASVRFASMIQAHWRGFYMQRNLRALRVAAIVVQQFGRMFVRRNHLLRLQEAAQIVQGFYRMLLVRRMAKKRVQAIRTVQCTAKAVSRVHYARAVLRLQAIARMSVPRIRLLRARRANSVLRAAARAYLARQEYQALLEKLDAEERKRIAEQKRLAEEAERRRVAEEEARLKREEEAKEKLRLVEEERKRQEDERKRLEEERVRKIEEERLRKEAEDVERMQKLREERARNAEVIRVIRGEAIESARAASGDQSIFEEVSMTYDVGESVLALNYVNYTWERATIVAAMPNGSYVVTFQQSRVQQETLPESLRPMNPEKVQMLMKSRPTQAVEFYAGDVVEAQYESQGWHPATVAEKMSATQYLVAFEDPDKSDQVLNVAKIQKRRNAGTGGDFKVGDMCEAQFSEDRNWYRARVDFVDPETQRFVVVFLDFGKKQECLIYQMRVASAASAQMNASFTAESTLAASAMQSELDEVEKVERLAFRYPVSKPEMPSDVANYKFPAFAHSNFRPEALQQKKSFTIRRKPVCKTLLYLADELDDKAVSVFEDIQQCALRKPNAAIPEKQIICILTEVILEPTLGDEVYCQLINQQLGQLPSGFYLVHLWQLLVCSAATFRPGPELEMYVLNHCRLSAQSKNALDDVRMLAKQTLTLLLRARAMKTVRKMVPVFETELFPLLSGASPVVTISYPAGLEQKTLSIDSATTAGECINALCDKLKVEDASRFAIMNESGTSCTALDPAANILDEMSNMNMLSRALSSQVLFELVFKKRMFLDADEPEQIADLKVLWPQVSSDLMKGRLVVPNERLPRFCAFVLHAEVGNWGPFRRILTELERYVPSNVLDRMLTSAAELETEILAEHKTLFGMERSEAIGVFMEEIRSLPTFGLSFFSCKYVHCSRRSLKLSTSLSVGIGCRGIRIMHPETNDQLLFIPYSRLADWSDGGLAGGPNVYFSVIGELGETPTEECLFDLAVASPDVKGMMDLLDAYAQVLLEQSCHARAILDVPESHAPNVLSFERGQRIVVSRKNMDGWFRGNLRDASGTLRIGFFPSNSVSMLFDEASPEQTVYSKSIVLQRFQTISPSSAAPPSLQGASTQLQAYAQTHFADRVQFKFSAVPIEKALHPFPKMTDAVFSMEMFVRVLKWCGDYPVGATNLFSTTAELIQKVMYEPALANELYAQIWKQTSENPKSESERKAFELFGVLAGVVKPAGALTKPLQEFMQQQRTGIHASLAQHCLQMFASVFARRRFAPSIKELLAVCQGHPIAFKVTVPRRPAVVLHIHPHTVVGEVCKQIAHQFKIQNHVAQGFGLLGMNQGAEGPFEAEALLCDIMTQWSRAPEGKKLCTRSDMLTLSGEELDTFQPTVVFKRLFFDDELTEAQLRKDPHSLQFLVDQTLADLKAGDLVVSYDVAARVVAYYARMMQAKDELPVVTSTAPAGRGALLVQGGRGGGLLAPPLGGTQRSGSGGGRGRRASASTIELPSSDAVEPPSSISEKMFVSTLFPQIFVSAFWAEAEMAIRGSWGMLRCAELTETQAAIQLILMLAKADLFGGVAFRARIEMRAVRCVFTRGGLRLTTEDGNIFLSVSYIEVVNVVATPSAFKINHGNIMAPEETVLTTHLGNEMTTMFHRFSTRQSKRSIRGK